MDAVAPSIEVLGLVGTGAGDFASQVAAWSPFFSTVAQVTGGLIGLVFVALTFNGQLAAGGDETLHDLARQTFSDFLSVLILSLVMLIPHPQAETVTLFALLFGGLGCVRIGRALWRLRRRRSGLWSGRTLAQRFLLSMIGNLSLVLTGLMLQDGGGTRVTFWSTLFASLLGLMLSASRSAWKLVVPDRDARR